MRPSTLLALLFAMATAPAAAQTAPATAEVHTLRAGDVLKVDVWGHTEFSGQFIVSETGQLQYPVLGDIEASTLTVAQLREKLRVGLETLFRSPFVTVTPVFRISVLGEVRQPSLYTVDPTLSVLDVIAMAGGPVPGANMGKVRVMRGGQALRMSFADGGSLQAMGVRSGDQIFVPRKAFTRDDLATLFGIVQLGISVAILAVTIGRQ